MDFFEVINTRRSVRSFNPDKPVNEDIIKRILKAGNIAPSASNRQPWKFIIVSSKQMLDKVRECYDRQWFKDAPQILVVIGYKDEAWVRNADNYNSIETDVTIAMDHMILAAHALGVSTCWIAAFNNNILRGALKLGQNEIVYSITPLGYTMDEAATNRTTRKPLDEVIQFI